MQPRETRSRGCSQTSTRRRSPAAKPATRALARDLRASGRASRSRRAPCGMQSRPRPRSRVPNSEEANPSSSWSFRASPRISNARPDRGTRCSRFPFMRLAGMVQTSSSISSPCRASNLVRTHRRQDHEFERQLAAEVGPRVANLDQSGGQLAVWEGLVMPDRVAVARQRRGDGVPGRVVRSVALRDGPTSSPRRSFDAPPSRSRASATRWGFRMASTSAVVTSPTLFRPMRTCVRPIGS